MKSQLLAIFASLLFRILAPDVTKEFADSEYEFIVVGAGTSGCVIASRLSDDPAMKVLLLEAGESDLMEPRITVPQYRRALGGSHVDWNYTTAPQENAFAFNPFRTFPYVRGKVLGGSSSINYMGYVRGSPHDYDSWERHGALGWNYKSVERYFRNVENGQGEGMPESLGRKGRLKMTKTNNSRTVTSDFMSQLARDLDISEGNYIDEFEGMSYSIRTVHSGLRQNSVAAYIRPLFPNRMKRLHVLTQALVTKILINGDMKAYGVQYLKDGKLFSVNARKEVIVSAGAFGSPHLLMLSGIDPKEELENFNISVRVNLPGVGSNLQDHLVTQNSFTTNVTFSKFQENPDKQFILKGMGPLADDEGFYVAKKSRYFNTNISLSNEEAPFPDMLSVLGGSESDNGKLTINVITILNHVKSTGKVSLKSVDPMILPLVNPRYYSNQDDLVMHVEGHRFMEELETSNTFMRAGAKYKQPFSCQSLFTRTIPRSKEFYECLIKHSAIHMCHACGTAKMGRPTDKWAVVDPKLRVYGVEGLRVADASVMPHITSANTQAPCYMIGEKAASMIKNYWKGKRMQ